MEKPNKKKVQRVVFFSILMAGALASVVALYKIALAGKGRISSSRPKTKAKSVVGGIPRAVPKTATTVVGGIPRAVPKT